MYSTSETQLGCTSFTIKCTAYPIIFIRSTTWVYCIYNQVYSISYYVHQEPCLGVLYFPAGALDLPSSVLHIVSCKSGASLGVLYLPTGVLHMPSCTKHKAHQFWKIGSNVLHVHQCTVETIMYSTSGAPLRCTTWVIKCTAKAMLYFRSPVHQEPHLGVLHFQSSVLHILSCSSGASLGCTKFAKRYTGFTIKCTAETIKYIKSLTWVYYICHQVYCICHHLTSWATLGCTTLAIKCTAEAMLYFTSPTWVYCICHQVYCISYHINQEPHLVYYSCHTGVLHMPSCTSGASLGCTAFAIKCTVETIMYSTSGAPLGCTAFVIKCTAYSIMFIRCLTWMYCICQQVYCRDNHVQYIRGPTWVYCICIKCTAYSIMFTSSLAWVYCICQQVH